MSRTLTLHLLHCLVASESTQSIDVGLAVQQLPQALCSEASQSVLDLHTAAQLVHILLCVHTAHSLPPLIVRADGSHGGVCKWVL